MDLPRLALGTYEDQLASLPLEFDQILHPVSVRLQIAFPDPSLLQYDCGKLQQLKKLLQEKKAGSHRVLIFTQMTRILDILEIFLNLNGYLYLRLDGATKIEDRQYITERFNADSRIFLFHCFLTIWGCWDQVSLCHRSYPPAVDWQRGF